MRKTEDGYYSIKKNDKSDSYIGKVKVDGKWVTKWIPKYVNDKKDAIDWLERWIADKTHGAKPKRLRRVRGSGYVYVAQLDNADGYVKLGWTNDLEVRRSHLQTGSPYKISIKISMPGSIADEGNLKRLFKSLKVRNEWFSAKILVWLEAAVGETNFQGDLVGEHQRIIERLREVMAASQSDPDN